MLWWSQVEIESGTGSKFVCRSEETTTEIKVDGESGVCVCCISVCCLGAGGYEWDLKVDEEARGEAEIEGGQLGQM